MHRELPSIRPDGSDRKFSRVSWQGKGAIKIEPSEGDAGLAEAWSFYRLGRHLYSKDIPVPQIYHFNEATGVLLVEDLGDVMLYDMVAGRHGKNGEPSIIALYEATLDVLVQMQLRGGQGLEPEWCWQGPIYDADLAYEKEASYFLNAFVKDWAKCEIPEAVVAELKSLVQRVRGFTCDRFFLHRDFQSRNVMVRPDGSIGIVDFQAGRFGPLGYDVASLLNDPYAGLDKGVRIGLLNYYVNRLMETGLTEAADEVMEQWPVLSALRLMQALGAYSFLSLEKGKEFFRSFIRPALDDLTMILDENFDFQMPATIELCHTLRANL
ncbi:MAG: phosphotransferase [Thermodesulfobacteria bacterium]|nr:phosphotransferase [Thermodesulfobacteriota bacterium]